MQCTIGENSLLLKIKKSYLHIEKSSLNNLFFLSKFNIDFNKRSRIENSSSPSCFEKQQGVIIDPFHLKTIDIHLLKKIKRIDVHISSSQDTYHTSLYDAFTDECVTHNNRVDADQASSEVFPRPLYLPLMKRHGCYFFFSSLLSNIFFCLTYFEKRGNDERN